MFPADFNPLETQSEAETRESVIWKCVILVLNHIENNKWGTLCAVKVLYYHWNRGKMINKTGIPWQASLIKFAITLCFEAKICFTFVTHGGVF